MLKARKVDHYSRDDVHSFLSNAGYKKFNLWPNATDKRAADFLFSEINKIHSTGKIIAVSGPGGITSLLAVNPLDWDTRHYGFKCAKIEYLLTDKSAGNSVREKSLDKLLVKFRQYCGKSKIKFAFVSADTNDFIVNLALQKAGFRYVLTWLDGIFRSFDKIPKIKEKADIGIIKPKEIDCLKKISARYYFKGGRFYLDRNFNKELVDKMYGELIPFSFKNNCLMLVYRVRGKPVGVFICKKIVSYGNFLNLSVAPLNFLVVDPGFRNKQVACNLFIRTLEYLKDTSDLVTTEVDSTNLPSINLHVKLGFRFNYTHNIYHWWNNSEH